MAYKLQPSYLMHPRRSEKSDLVERLTAMLLRDLAALPRQEAMTVLVRVENEATRRHHRARREWLKARR